MDFGRHRIGLLRATHQYPKTATKGLVWLFAFLLAWGLSMLTPPMQSPDEMSHITRAFLISKGQLLLQPLPEAMSGLALDPEAKALIERAHRHGGRIGGWVDLGLLEFVDAYSPLITDASRRLQSTERMHAEGIQWADRYRFYFTPGTGYYFPAIYAPQALGLAVGRGLDLTVHASYRLARLVTSLACFAMLWLGFRLAAPNPWIVAILVLPMSVFQLVSPTIDGLTSSLAILTMGLLFRSTHRALPCSKIVSWCLAVSVFLLANSRTHLLPLLLLPFFLAWRRQSHRDFYLGILVLAATLGWIYFAVSTTNDPRIVREHGTSFLLQYYLTRPGEFVRVIATSLSDPDLARFYQQSFIGILGWLDAKLPLYFYPVLWLGIGLCGLVSVSVTNFHQEWPIRVLLLMLSLASVGLIFLALLITWSPHPALKVEGVQGRYFVVPMLMMGYVLGGFSAHPSAAHRLLGWVAASVFALMSLVALTMTLVARYH